MLFLSNAHLRIHVLDPVADEAWLGTRFCSGGYVWEVEDRAVGPLLSGPEGADPTPNPFNGHGLPEAFRDRTRDGRQLTWTDGIGLAPGIGLLRATAGGAVELVERCAWKISAYRDRLTFETEQGVGDRAYTLTRMIQLVDREVISTTRFSNVGLTPLQLQWFAHPFFALMPDGRLSLEVPAGSQLPPNPGFTLEHRQLSLQRRFHGEHDGHFDLLQLPPGAPVQARIDHPRLEHVTFSCDFIPSECPIWANGHTFSIEPYRTLALAPVETEQWTLRYGFGASSSDRSTASGQA